MAGSMVLVPIDYPITERITRTLERAIAFVNDREYAHLYLFHVNLRHKGNRVNQRDLRRAVERAVGTLENASYHVRSAFLLEEAILHEAVQIDADFILIGKRTKARWRKLITDRLDLDVDLEAFLRQQLDAELIIL